MGIFCDERSAVKLTAAQVRARILPLPRKKAQTKEIQRKRLFSARCEARL